MSTLEVTGTRQKVKREREKILIERVKLFLSERNFSQSENFLSQTKFSQRTLNSIKERNFSKFDSSLFLRENIRSLLFCSVSVTSTKIMNCLYLSFVFFSVGFFNQKISNVNVCLMLVFDKSRASSAGEKTRNFPCFLFRLRY